MARLKACMFQKPIPPWSLDRHIFLQLTYAILFSLAFCPHQKLRIIFSKSWQSVLGSWKQLIVYVGTAWATALIRISLPPIERSLPFQPASFLATLSLTLANTCVFYFPMMEGSPRYLLCRESCIGPRMSRMLSFKSWGVFGLKKTEDLLVLIFYPEASSYLLRILTSAWHSWTFALQNKRLSSAKKRWVIKGQPLQMEIPFICWFLAASWMRAENPSAQRRKRQGESGSPCLVPFEGKMFPQASPFISTE